MLRGEVLLYSESFPAPLFYPLITKPNVDSCFCRSLVFFSSATQDYMDLVGLDMTSKRAKHITWCFKCQPPYPV